jgi:energy-converting hydrogenase A subunit M
MKDSTMALLNLIFSGMVSIGVVIAVIQLILMKKQATASLEQAKATVEQAKAAAEQAEAVIKQTKIDIDLAKNTNTVNIASEWCKAISKETSYAEDIVENFTKEQCEALHGRKPFEVNDELKKRICVICPNRKNNCHKCETLIVDGLLLLELRWHIIRYLNSLETALLAWRYEVVDKAEFESQFAYLYDPERDEGKRDILSDFRNAAGNGTAYRIINTFCETLRNNREKQDREEIEFHKKKQIVDITEKNYEYQ